MGKKRNWRKFFGKYSMVLIGGIMFLIMVIVAFLATSIAPYDPQHMNMMESLRPPSAAHLCGTDEFGRDVFSRIIYGARISLSISLSVLVLVGIFGTVLGMLAGFYHTADTVIMRFMDGLMAFPTVILALVILTVLGSGIPNLVLALSCRPRLLIADEPTTALDVTIQAQILKLMRNLKETLDTSVMLITHDLGVVREVCSRAIIFYCGQVIEEGPVEELFENPCHPYTQGLLKSLPVMGSRDRLYVIPGTVPSPGNLPEGCVFNPRCGHATEKCRNCRPQMTDISDGHCVRCWLYDKEG